MRPRPNQPPNPDAVRPAGEGTTPTYVLAVHGGAGVVSRGSLQPDQEALIRRGLREAVEAGVAVLAAGGRALDAVTAAVCHLEDWPWFNAGKGSVLNREGFCQMDAAVMEGAARRAGAVAGVRRPRNPVLAARAVLERTTHVLLAGEGGDQFAEAQGLAVEPASYFITEGRRKQWRRVLRELGLPVPARELETLGMPSGVEPSSFPGPTSAAEGSVNASLWKLERKADAFGTVGAVALDLSGDLAAATSTGGLAGKLPGRIGDSPLIGAGTWADNGTCAVSATGHGEHFIRNVVAHEVASRMAHGGRTLAEAARGVIEVDLVRLGGDGGLIAVDRLGNVVLTFNTPGMYRAVARRGEAVWTGIYGGESGEPGFVPDVPIDPVG